MIRIIAVGKKHEDWVASGIDRYEKRLRKPFDIEWTLLPHSTFEGDKARQEESERIVSRLSDRDVVILLDERGWQWSSEQISNELERLFTDGRFFVFIIGGAYGVDERLTQRADSVVSLSKMVFPHQLVRLILTEQLYRAQEIAGGGKYHHD